MLKKQPVESEKEDKPMEQKALTVVRVQQWYFYCTYSNPRPGFFSSSPNQHVRGGEPYLRVKYWPGAGSNSTPVSAHVGCWGGGGTWQEETVVQVAGI